MAWDLRVTVAAVIERDERFLLVEERQQGQWVFNQPAGHLEAGESLLQAVIRETLEETTCIFQPEAIVGLYTWAVPNSERSYLRVAFCGHAGRADPQRSLDTGIIATHWLSWDDLKAARGRWRSPLVGRCIEDYRAGRRYPLDLLVDLPGHE